MWTKISGKCKYPREQWSSFQPHRSLFLVQASFKGSIFCLSFANASKLDGMLAANVILLVPMRNRAVYQSLSEMMVFLLDWLSQSAIYMCWERLCKGACMLPRSKGANAFTSETFILGPGDQRSHSHTASVTSALGSPESKHVQHE